MASMPRTIAAPAPIVGFRLDRRLLWEQEMPILDLVGIDLANLDNAEAGGAGNRMLVLDTAGITLYEQRDSKWQKAEGVVLEIPPVRDPRGRLTVMENSVVAENSGADAVKVHAKPSLAVIECQQGGRFTAGRNHDRRVGMAAVLCARRDRRRPRHRGGRWTNLCI